MDSLNSKQNFIIHLRRSTMPFYERMTSKTDECIKNFHSKDRVRELRFQKKVMSGGILVIILFLLGAAAFNYMSSTATSMMILIVFLLLLLRLNIGYRISIIQAAKKLKSLDKRDLMD